EEKELIIIKQYLPPELGEAEITDLVKEIIKENNSTSPADFGKVMKLAIAKVAGQADGSKVSQIVKELLEQNQ
ncbi:GatB/YqeY domain-containing protein, partial [Patescibacteria group bacterium]|nr:GatB/YqeY domain-containing protein [Patescibacteria group bacterium]